MAENVHAGKWQKMHNRKMPEWKLYDTDNVRTEIAQLGRWQKMQVPENCRKYTTGKCQNGKCTTWKLAENAHTGNGRKCIPGKYQIMR